MQTIEVVAQRGTDPAVTVSFEVGENLQELISQFGDEVVFSHTKRSVIIALQGFMRSLIDQGREKGSSYADTANGIVEAVKSWKPSQRRVPKTTQEKARDILQRLSPTERQALLKEYRSKGSEKPISDAA